MTVTHLLLGPRKHGVVRFGWDLCERMHIDGFDVRCVWSPDIAGLREIADVDALHLQFTDRLFGHTPGAAAEFVRALAAPGRRLTATLHDIPQPSDGAGFARRAAAYADVAGVCDRIVVSSKHELQLLQDNGINVCHADVIPLPIGDRSIVEPAPTARRTIGLFGFIYPGKGHAEVIAAAANLPTDVEILALGDASHGHDDLVRELHSIARGLARRLHVTGHVDDAQLARMLQMVTVPVIAHQHISASGSLNSWLAAGRRPIAPRNRYMREFESRNPGSVALYADTALGLRTAIERALASPETTWLAADATLYPTPADTAKSYDRLLVAARR